MKNLIVYYSLNGNTKFVARKIALNTESKLLKLKYKNNFDYPPILKSIIGSFQALFKYKPPLQDFDVQNNKYDTLFIGTPVWVHGISPAVRSFLEKTEIKVNKYVLFSTYKGSKGWSFKQMKKYLPEDKIAGKKGFKNVLQNKEQTEKEVINWLKK
ncbi:MAG: flavodoxin family protein, partial [Bacillota bacterium]